MVSIKEAWLDLVYRVRDSDRTPECMKFGIEIGFLLITKKFSRQPPFFF